MAVRAVSHVAIGVTDMDRALRFYRDALGLSVTQDTTQDFPPYGDAETPGEIDLGLKLHFGPDTCSGVEGVHLN